MSAGANHEVLVIAMLLGAKLIDGAMARTAEVMGLKIADCDTSAAAGPGARQG
jgi:hypothetical protein